MVFEFLLDKILVQPTLTYLGKGFLIYNIYHFDDNYQKFIIHDCDANKIYSLGASVFYYAYYWNQKILDTVSNRSKLSFLGERIFTGTDEEKLILNQSDLDRLIDFPPLFFETFINNFRTINRNFQSDFFNVTFITTLNVKESISSNDDNLNSNFGNKFKVLDVYLDDTMYFAKIFGENISFEELFCLGYTIVLNDEMRTKDMRTIKEDM